MRIHAILNAQAGTLLDQDKNEFVQSVGRVLRAGGNEVEVELAEPGEIDAATDRALAGTIDVLVMGGGDGTIRAAAAKLVGREIALGIIPLGTLNRLARDLKVPFDPEEAAAVIAEGERVAIDVAEVNGRIFLCTSLLGLPIRVAEQRQALRGSGFGERIRGYTSLLRNVLTNRRRFAVEVDDGNVAQSVRAISIAVSNNPLAETPGMALTRPRIDSGRLALYLSKHRSGGAMGLAVIRRMFGKSGSDPEIEELCAKRIVLRSRRAHVQVSNDGEIEELTPPLRYSIAPRALCVMAPRSA
jgi:diacylglycerol kinase family enzyme